MTPRVSSSTAARAGVTVSGGRGFRRYQGWRTHDILRCHGRE